MIQYIYRGFIMKNIAFFQNECCLLFHLFFVFGSFSADAYCPKLLAIFFPDRQFLLDSKYLEFAIYRVMIWILVKTGHGYLFRIPREKWLWYSILTVLVVVLQISFNVQTAKHVQSTAEGWAVLIGYRVQLCRARYLYSPVFLTPLMEELIYRGLLQHAFFKDSRFGLASLPPYFILLSSFFKPALVC